jgi:hypothetical protein
MQQKIKDLFEKLKAHAEKNNDPELQQILDEYQSSLEATVQDDGPGENNPPEQPDIP